MNENEPVLAGQKKEIENLKETLKRQTSEIEKSKDSQIAIANFKSKIGDLERELNAKMKEIDRLHDFEHLEDFLRVELKVTYDEIKEENRGNFVSKAENEKLIQQLQYEKDSAKSQINELTHQLALQYENIKLAERSVCFY